MRTFRLAITGDFLNERGESACGDLGFGPLEEAPHVRIRYLRDHQPDPSNARYWERLYSMEVTPEHLRDTDGLIVLRPWVMQSAFREGAADLTVIGRSGAGYDKIDLAAATENDVAVFNAPFALNHATASAALLLILALAKRLPQQERIARLGRWDLQSAAMGSELPGRTLGIIGLGHSGRELVRLVAPFEMNVLAYSPHADPAEAERLGVRLTSLDELLAASDFVSLHARLTPETRGMLGADELARMKRTAYLVNVARGELVDQPALVRALATFRLAGAGLDVYAEEPPPPGDPILNLPNVILTPHWLASTTDVWQATGRAMSEGMLRAARGEPPDNVVNPQVLGRPGFRRKLARFAASATPQA